ETVSDLIGNTEVVHTPARPGDFGGKLVSSERAARELDWRATTPLAEGVRRYLEWRRPTNGHAPPAPAAAPPPPPGRPPHPLPDALAGGQAAGGPRRTAAAPADPRARRRHRRLHVPRRHAGARGAPAPRQARRPLLLRDHRPGRSALLGPSGNRPALRHASGV